MGNDISTQELTDYRKMKLKNNLNFGSLAYREGDFLFANQILSCGLREAWDQRDETGYNMLLRYMQTMTRQCMEEGKTEKALSFINTAWNIVDERIKELKLDHAMVYPVACDKVKILNPYIYLSASMKLPPDITIQYDNCELFEKTERYKKDKVLKFVRIPDDNELDFIQRLASPQQLIDVGQASFTSAYYSGHSVIKNRGDAEKFNELFRKLPVNDEILLDIENGFMFG
jgi:hypothetical protein